MAGRGRRDRDRRHRRAGAAGARRPLQPIRPAEEPRPERVGADRGPAQAAARPDPQPRRDRQGLRGARARHVRGGHGGARRGAGRSFARRGGPGRGDPEPGPRPALRGRRGVPGAAGGREFPSAAERARRDREPDRGLPAGLQRHRADVQQRDPDVPRRRDRRPVRVRGTGVLRDGRGGARRPARRLHTTRRRERRLPRHRPLRPPSPPRARAAPPVARARRALALAAAAAAALTLAGVAHAQSRSTCRRRTSPSTVAKDGSLVVDEDDHVRLQRLVHGAFRDIPLRSGESIDEIAVSEGGRSYRPGACVELGCSDAPGTYGTTRVGDGSSGSSGTTRRATSCARSTSTTASAAWRSPTTTSWT